MTSPQTTSTTQRDSGIMPWSIAGAGLVGLLTLTLNAGLLPLPPVMALMMLVSYVLPYRLEGQTFNRWWVRLALLIIIIVLNQSEPGNNDFAFGNARVRNILAQVYAAEMVVQCWRRSGDPVRSRLIALSASGLLMLTASNTFDERFVKFTAPLYLIFIGLGQFTLRSRQLSRFATVIRVFLLILTVGMSGAGYLIVDYNRTKITEIGNRLLGERLNLEASGMASSPSLGETFGLRGGTERVLRIHHPVGDGHLRGMAFDSYSQGRWGPAFVDRQYRSVLEQQINPPAALKANTNEMTIERMVGDNPLIYAPLQMAAFAPGDATDVDWAVDSGGPLRTRTRPPYEYRVSVAASDTYQGLLATPVREEDRSRYLQLPPRFDPRVSEIARKITAGAKTDRDKVEAVVNYLISNYSYSLTFKPGAGEPLVNFLTAEPKRPAHCEYFASASTILLRCVGVPTRYVTGYMAHENDGEDMIVVRQRDAHAWSEAWVKGIGWITVEATPGDGRPDADNSAPEWWRRLMEKTQDSLQAFAELLASLTMEQVLVIVGAIVAGGIFYGVHLFRRRKMAIALAAFAYTPPERRLAELIVRFEAVFAKRGIAIPVDRPYREHLNRLAVGDPAREAGRLAPIQNAARQFVEIYDGLRFGNKGSESALDTLSRLVDDMEQTK